MTPAEAIIRDAQAAGLTLHAVGASIRVEPRSGLTDELRARIIAEKPAILAALRARDQAPPADRTSVELAALVERVARSYQTPPDELADMKRLALADPAAAWSAFLTTAQTEGFH